MRTPYPWLVILAASAMACSSSSDSGGCNPSAQTGCGAGLACEVVSSGGTTCAAPVVVKGHVFSLATSAAIANARVIATDANGSPLSSVAITGADGSFEMRVANPRSADGTPIAEGVLLRADARGYRTFPSGIRQAFPVSTADGVLANGVIVVAGQQTEIGLETDTGGGTAAIHGVAAVPQGAPGVLVVAERQDGDATVGASALADRNGDYAIFNLPAASYTVRAFARGAVHTPQSVSLDSGADALVNVPISGATTATVAGNLQIVNPGQGTGTSVILVVESTFNADLVRGDMPPGLRAPKGLLPDLQQGNYEIPGVPPGKYIALAAYEDDFLVRDPDVCIGGTQIVHFEVAQASGTVTLSGFKVTGSLDVISPGATAPEEITWPPTFRWVDDSSEDAYHITVIDSAGTVRWSKDIPGYSGSGNPSFTYDDPTRLAPGYYQFKVKSSKGTCIPTGQTVPVTKFLSTTEDLKGVFIVPPAP